MIKSKYLLVFLIVFPIVSFAQEVTVLEGKGEIIITKLDVLSSKSQEGNLCISPNGRHIYFMSTRGEQRWSRERTNRSDYDYGADIWTSTKVDGNWQKPRCLGDEVNTSNNEDEPMIAGNGRSIAFESWGRSWEYTGGPYYQATLVGKKFTNVHGLGGGISKFFLKTAKKSYNAYATDGASMSRDGKTFIVCCGPSYTGPMDIYISRKVKGEWSKLKKMSISTPQDERTAFIAHDGKTIYFASSGYNGFGGMDIYKTVLDEKGKPGEVVNIGAPFNTGADDRGFIISNDGDDAYFIRDEDIYYANTKEANNDMKPSHMEKVTNNLVVQSKTITITYWDNSQQDGDIVSLKIDGEYIFQNLLLTKKKREVVVNLQSEVNDIVLRAENVGGSPPNTAAFIIDDGVTRQRLRLKSDKEVSSTMRITVERAGE